MKWRIISKKMTRVPVDKLKTFTKNVFMKVGVPEEDALTAAEVLVAADMRGVSSHGVARLDIYVKRILAGVVNTKPRITVVKDSGPLALVDGDNGLGFVVGTKAMSLAIEKAKKYGIGAVGARKSNHFGIAGYYAMMALKHDMIGFATTHASPLVAPTGGKAPFFGTNPIAVAIPAGTQPPVVLDMAVTVVARGKIEEAIRRGQKIPLGWALDKDGRPTEDPHEALKGTLLPIGGYKGYGLALVVDVICGLLTGASYGKNVGSLFGDLTRPQNLGHFFAAIDVNAFQPADEFKRKMDEYILEIKNSPKAEGVEEILLPGEPEWRKTREALEKGIELHPKVLEALRDVAVQVGLVEKDTPPERLFELF